MESLRHHYKPHVDNTFAIDLPPSHQQVKQEERKARARPSLLRVIIRVITLGVSASNLAVLALSVAVWYSTRNTVLSQPGKLPQPGWPATMDMKPTWLMLAASVVAVLIHFFALCTLVCPIRRLRESNLHTWTVFITAVACTAMWIGVVAYFKVQELKGAPIWTLWSWSCSHEDWTNGKMAFSSMCTKLKYSFYAGVAVAVLEFASLVLFAIQLRNIKKQGHGYTRITVQQMR
ncbi:hypothetical protein CLCR_07464 [Cladophialophora carrionii]|uniref:Uncharacterized protein n=1 Tax=Cladophialophora carrionii TaxID=86049 RepID=A0A1C1CQ70_9EURO|nr:hypothetical protein CLCR_07464 [Cladophialophora carrionii]